MQRLSRTGPVAKKTLIAEEIDRADVAKARQDWKAAQSEIHPDRVVIIDETWAKTNMTGTYGRSAIGTRVIQKILNCRWETTTFVGGLRSRGFIAPLTVDGPINGDGKPTDNAFIESFNGSVRAECLNENWFLSLDDA